MKKIKYKQILDYIIGLMYVFRYGEDKVQSVSMKKVIQFFDYEVTFEELKDISKYLEAKGYITAHYIYGDISAQITTRGIIHFEELDEEIANEFFRKFEKKLDSFNSQEDESTTKKTLVGEVNELYKMIEKEKNKSLNDYLTDVKILLSELEKEQSDKEILALKSNALLDNTKYRNKVLDIIQKLNLE